MTEIQIIKNIFKRITQLSKNPSKSTIDLACVYKIEKLIQASLLLSNYLIKENQNQIEEDIDYYDPFFKEEQFTIDDYADIFGFTVEEIANDLMIDPNDLTEDDIDDYVGR